jgi:hypothetical protein
MITTRRADALDMTAFFGRCFGLWICLSVGVERDEFLCVALSLCSLLEVTRACLGDGSGCAQT